MASESSYQQLLRERREWQAAQAAEMRSPPVQNTEGDDDQDVQTNSSFTRAEAHFESELDMNDLSQRPRQGHPAEVVPDLTEARRLFDAGFKLCKLKPNSKRPDGDGWNVNPITVFDNKATGYGAMLATNSLCSIDPDRLDESRRIMAAWGFDLNEIMSAGARTASTRPGSGGRAVFRDPGQLTWLTFAFHDLGTVLELRARSANLQDVLPGVVYLDKSGALRTQNYVNGTRVDDRPGLPDPFLAWWHRCSNDVVFLREQQRIASEVLGIKANLAVSSGGGTNVKLAFESPYRIEHNQMHQVEEILPRHGYTQHEERWAPHTATGAPSVRLIAGKDDLWQSSHASDPLFGTFDAWTAFVVLDHKGDLKSAEAAFSVERQAADIELFNDYDAEARTKRDYIFGMIDGAELMGIDDVELTGMVKEQLLEIQQAKDVVAEVVARMQAKVPQDAKVMEQRLGVKDDSRVTSYPYNVAVLKPYEFVVDGFLGIGLAVIAGMPGIGKTSLLVPLAAAVAHLFDSPLAPVLRRKVIYFSESPRQVESVLYGLAKKAPGAKPHEFAEWFTVVPSHRLKPERLAKVITRAVRDNTVVFNGYKVAPLIVLDTSNATVDLENENDNSEVGKAIAAIKENLGTGACWLVQHIAKSLKRADVTEMTARGAGAFGGDAEATAFVFAEDEIPNKRFMWLDKHRFEAAFREVEFTTTTDSETVETPWQTSQTITYRVGLPAPSNVAARKAAVEEVKERNQENRRVDLEREILTFVAQNGACSRRKISDGIGGKAKTNYDVINQLVADGKLVPTGEIKGGADTFVVGPDPDFDDVSQQGGKP